MKRVLLASCLLLLASSRPILAADEAQLIASDYSDRYHWSTCKIAQKIYPDERLTFRTPEEAVAARLAPCKKCNPPVSSAPPDDSKKYR